MTGARLIELVVAIAILAVGIVLYRRRPAGNGNAGESYGNQGAVLLLVVASIMAIHATGLLEYHPSPSELDAFGGGTSR